MASKLLQTRLTIPPRRAGAVARPRLVDRLNAGLHGRLTVLSAPAGFGKTTLVLEWLDQLPAAGYPWTRDRCAWVSLNPADDRLERFFAYLIGALQRTAPGFAAELFASLDSPGGADFTILVQELLNEFAGSGAPFLIVLDDYHAITDEAIHELLNLIVEYLPPNIHLVLTSRDTPQLDLPRWRARGYLNEIAPADLRFKSDEVRAFVSGTMQLDLPDELTTALENQTEGWAAGLQLAALALRGQREGEGRGSHQWHLDVSGRDRAIADYLITEVLDRQPPEVQDFLFRTSILPQFTAGLCDSLLAVPASAEAGTSKASLPAAALLESLEKSDLFLVPLDSRRHWYRYHHLFGELLQSRLVREWPSEQIGALHLAASDWFREQGMLVEAIDQAFQAGAGPRAAKLIEEIPRHQLWHSETGGRIPDWVPLLPPEAIRRHPAVLLQAAGAQLIRGRISDLRQSLAALEHYPEFDPQRSVLEAVLVRNNGQLTEALAMLEDAVQRLPEKETVIRDIAYLQMAVCSMQLGRYEQGEGYTELIISRYAGRPAGQRELVPVHFQALQIQGDFVEIRGDLNRAHAIYRSGLDLVEDSGDPSPLSGLFFARLGSVHYQWNELKIAEDYFEQAVIWGERTRISDVLFGGLFGLADLASSRGNQEMLQDVIDQFNALVRDARIPGLEASSAGIAAWYRLRAGELDRSVRWANTSGLPLDVPPPYPLHPAYQTLIAIRVVESRKLATREHLPAMLKLVDQLISQAEQVQNRKQMILDHVLRALVLEGLEEHKEAVRALYRALELGLPFGYRRIYLDAGEALHDLLQKALPYGEHITEIRSLLVDFAKEPSMQPAAGRLSAPSSPASTAPLVEPLTERETEVLQLIASGLTNKDIQERLFISNNTVRTHIKNLYGKLGVSDRTQAVLRAQALGLA